jgi:SRSO17 transposase
MQLAQPSAIAASFDDFHAHFATCFQRSETRQRVRAYSRGLLATVKRKNCWQIAEVMGEGDPQGLQRLLYEALWEADEVCGRLRGVIRQRIGYMPGIGVLDESGFVKKGSQSVGVKRQYCGRVGKVENGQVGVFLGYVAPEAHALLDRELYLPREWCGDWSRRRAAHVPDGVVFHTKPQLAQIMLARAWAEGIEMQWVSADTTYGNSADLRDFIHQQRRCYGYLPHLQNLPPFWSFADGSRPLAILRRKRRFCCRKPRCGFASDSGWRAPAPAFPRPCLYAPGLQSSRGDSRG